MALEYMLDFERPIYEMKRKIDEMRILSHNSKMDMSDEISQFEGKLEKLKNDIYNKLTPWNKVQIARHPRRPFTLDYIERIVTDFRELHGDRLYADDHAIVGGLGNIDGRSVMIIGHQKGRDTKQNIYHNFGMPNPEGYRKALRLMKLADRFHIPVVTLIDTPGAYPGLGAEERGQAEAIARNLYEMAGFGIPLLGIVIGEGGSGGALALGVTDRVLILENSIYSVISPEGCSSILFKDAKHAEELAQSLHLTAPDLKELGIVDQVIPEPSGGAHNDWDRTISNVKDSINTNLAELSQLGADQLVAERLQRYQRMGKWAE
jgi:acetyl-CoA carboxylase carboxyl transferase subunit alpha